RSPESHRVCLSGILSVSTVQHLINLTSRCVCTRSSHGIVVHVIQSKGVCSQNVNAVLFVVQGISNLASKLGNHHAVIVCQAVRCRCNYWRRSICNTRDSNLLSSEARAGFGNGHAVSRLNGCRQSGCSSVGNKRIASRYPTIPNGR